MPEEKYFKKPGMNSSGLKKFSRSPLHYYAEYRDPNRIKKPPTLAMQMGTALHGLIFDGEVLWRTAPAMSRSSNLGKALHMLVLTEERDWYISPVEKRGTKDEKAAYNAFVKTIPEGALILKPSEDEKVEALYEAIPESERPTGLPPDAPILSKEDAARVEAMARSIMEEPEAIALLYPEQYTKRLVEHPVSWLDKEHRVLCKAQLDCVIWDSKTKTVTVADLKSTVDASADVFANQMTKLQYYIQAAFYLRAAKKLFPKAKEYKFVFIAVENVVPFATAVHTLDKYVLEQAEREISEYLGIYKQCLNADHWPGYDNDDYESRPLHLSAWARDAQYKQTLYKHLNE